MRSYLVMRPNLIALQFNIFQNKLKNPLETKIAQQIFIEYKFVNVRIRLYWMY